MPRARLSLLLPATLLLSVAPLAGQADWVPPDATLVERARAILQQVPLIDGHNDLPSRLLGEFGGSMEGAGDVSGPQPGGHTDLARLRAGLVGAQFWSAYVTVDSMEQGALRHGIREIDMVHRLTERYADFEIAYTADDIERIHGDGRIASLIGLEGGHAIENSLSALRALYRLGVRYITLTHSRTHDWADASTDAPRHGGLSPFGVEVVREMNRLGVFVDLSHVAPSTMHDALDVAAAPVLFSHSSARAVTDHPRNVPDDVLRRLPENGGVVMITFVPSFINEDVRVWSARSAARADSLRAAGLDAATVREAIAAWEAMNPQPRTTLADVADHIDHVRRVAGIDHIGIGSDFDGISSVPVGLEDVATFPVLFAELLRRGYSEEDLRQIAGLNVLRAMRAMETTAARLRQERSPSTADVRR
ncbi:MAG: dipeptidase [Longimicrobiales bacterium]